MPEEVKKSKILRVPYFKNEISLFPDGNFIERNRGEKLVLTPNSGLTLNIGGKFKRISDEQSCRYHRYAAARAELWSPKEGSERTQNFRLNFRQFVHFETSIDYYQMRPVTIPFYDGDGNYREYRPLALLTYSTDLSYIFMKPVLVDVWSEDDIKDNCCWFYPAWREASRFAKQNGWQFCLIRDYFFDTPIYRNACFLLRFRDYPVKNPYFSRLTREIRRLKRVKINKLMENICDGPEDYAATLPQLWYLLDANFVGYDLTELLTMNSQIWFD